VITLFDYELSGNCYKVRLLLALLGISYSCRPVDFYPGREHKQPWFLALNPLGQLPVLEDEGFVLHDSQAILVYLASRYDESGLWYPRGEAALLGTLTEWLMFADAIANTAAAARLHDGMFYEFDVEQCRLGAQRLFRILDERLWFSERGAAGWICEGTQPTIADIAVFPYVQLSEEGGIAHRDYPAIRRWLDRVKLLPGFIPMPGIIPPPGILPSPSPP
jgi:glutathione S-transferase